MSALLSMLSNWGCDVNGTMERFMDDEELYRSCLAMAMDDAGFDGLMQAVNHGDAPAAFEYAHTLKGVLANLGLTPLYDIVVRIVEPLRASKTTDHLVSVCEELMQKKAQLEALLGPL